MQAIVQKRVINVKYDFWQIQQTNKTTAYLEQNTSSGTRTQEYILVMEHFQTQPRGIPFHNRHAKSGASWP